MKLIKFMIIVLFVTCATFAHAHQRVEAVRYSYEIKEKRTAFDKLLDRKSELEYNVARLKSPRYLELELAKRDLKMVQPERWQVIGAGSVTETDARAATPLFIRNIAGFFSLRSVAHAKPAVDTLTRRPY